MKKILVFVCLVVFLVTFVSAATAADRFVKNNDGTVTDNQTGLMWADHDSSDITWRGANSYCEGYSGGGKSGWRMPTLDELTQPYNSGAYGSVIRRTGNDIWSSETRGSEAALFDFSTGRRGWTHQSYGSYYGLALPVRSGK